MKILFRNYSNEYVLIIELNPHPLPWITNVNNIFTFREKFFLGDTCFFLKSFRSTSR